MTVQAKAGHLWVFRPALARLRAGPVVWIVLAVAGWATAGGLAVATVRAHQVAARFAAEAGRTPVSGPGIEIVLTDASRAPRTGENPSLALVQDSDLIFLNMMLWYGGARAVAINGERVTAQTTITSSGPTLVINRRRLVGPFHVVAVGDPRVLRGVIETRGGFADRMRESGLGVEIHTHPNLVVPARDGDAL